MNEISYFGLTNDHTWLSVDEEYYKKLKPTHRMKCFVYPKNCVNESDFDQALRERDNYHAAADSLAEEISNYFGIYIGEHSNANNPWVNALEYIESQKLIKKSDIDRAIKMLEVAAEYIDKTDPYGLIHYDDADCDGGCVAEDCNSIAESLRKAQDK